MKTFSQLKKLLLIINPVSGRRTSLRFLPDIIRIFSEGDYAVTVFPTGKSGDATHRRFWRGRRDLNSRALFRRLLP